MTIDEMKLCTAKMLEEFDDILDAIVPVTDDAGVLIMNDQAEIIGHAIDVASDLLTVLYQIDPGRPTKRRTRGRTHTA